LAHKTTEFGEVTQNNRQLRCSGPFKTIFRFDRGYLFSTHSFGRNPKLTTTRNSALRNYNHRFNVRVKMRFDVLIRLGVVCKCDRQTDVQTQPRRSNAAR